MASQIYQGKKQFTYPHLVEYYETDAMGIVHHSNYLRWFESARCAFLADLGLPYQELEAIGIAIPVMDIEVKYLLPARFADEVVVETVLSSYNGIKVYFSYEIKRGSDLLVRGTSSHCFLSVAQERPCALQRNFLAIHEQIIGSLEPLVEA